MKAILCRTLAALVRESGIPHPELARRAGIGERTLRSYLAGERFPHSLDALLRQMEVTAARFLMRAASEALAGSSRHGMKS